MTREDWLQKAFVELSPMIKAAGGELHHDVACLVGLLTSKQAIGQCFGKSHSINEDRFHIFICPTLADPVKVLATLLHEMIHACDIMNHGKEFKKIALAVGLAGKMRSTYVEEGSFLHAELVKLAEELGEYPHQPMVKQARKTQGGGNKGWPRFKSEVEERYKVLVSPKMLEEFGAPMDPWGKEMVPC